MLDFHDRLPRHLEVADERVEHGAVGIDRLPVLLRAAKLPGGGGELGVIPDHHREHVERGDPVLVALQLGDVGVGLAGGHGGRVLPGELLDQEGRDLLDLEVLVALLVGPVRHLGVLEVDAGGERAGAHPDGCQRECNPRLHPWTFLTAGGQKARS
jgi:hypothetical protein